MFIIGSFIGLICKKIIKKDICDSILKALGITVMLIGIVGAAEYMLPISEDKSLPNGGSLLIIIAIALGTLVGELINIDKGLNILGDKIEKKINLNLVGKEKLKSTSYLNTSSHTHTHKLKEVPWIVALCKIAKKL